MTDKTMTLEQVRDKLRSWYGGSEACLDVKACSELGAMIDAITRHLSQPAERGEAPVGYARTDGCMHYAYLPWSVKDGEPVYAAQPPAAGVPDMTKIGAPAWPGQLDGLPPPDGWSALSATPSPTIDVAAVRVDHEGVQFGTSCWYSHEHITGATADKLNEGTGDITQRAYMKWVQARLAIGDAK